MRLAEHLFRNLERLAVYDLCVGVLALAKEHLSEGIHGRERGRVRVAEHLFRDLESLAVYSLRVGELALTRENKSEATHICKC